MGLEILVDDPALVDLRERPGEVDGEREEALHRHRRPEEGVEGLTAGVLQDEGRQPLIRLQSERPDGSGRVEGSPDLVFAPARKTLAKPAIFLGNGKGKWALWTQARYPAVAYDYGGAAAADFNADGKQDIALGMHLPGFTALTGDGKGTFSD